MAWLGVFLAPLGMAPTHSVQAEIRAVATPVVSSQSAPALVQDSAEALRRALLARLEFEELNLQLIGVAKFGDQTACTIKHPGASEPMIYRNGDVVGGYQIVAIDQTSVTFSRSDLKFYLTAGEISNGSSAAGSAIDEEGATSEDASIASPIPAPPAPSLSILAGPALDQFENDAQKLKTASEDLKQKTRRFDTAKLIEEVTADEGGVKGSRSRSGKMFALPLRGRFTSGYGYRRHPTGGGIRFHRGIDIAAPYDASIFAAADGIVHKSGWTPTLGQYVTINHRNGYSTRYGHMSRRLVKPGDHVGQGEVIGRVGSTGDSTGNHLHFEIRKNQVARDPEDFLKIRR